MFSLLSSQRIREIVDIINVKTFQGLKTSARSLNVTFNNIFYPQIILLPSTLGSYLELSCTLIRVLYKCSRSTI